ncbi:MAG: hypothetical protein ACFFDB_00530 [Promethearchaeota archaeon]
MNNEDEFIGREFTPELKDNWEEYLKTYDIKDFWEYTNDFAKELFVKGYFWGNDFRMRIPFLKPVENKPLLLYYFTNTFNGEPVLSDSGDTIRQIKTLKLKNPITEVEMQKIQDILKITGCRFNKFESERGNAIVSIEIKTKKSKIAINSIKLGQAILMIYGLFSKWLRKYEESFQGGIFSEEHQKYVNRWNELAHK